ncbi:hypothetical protein N5D61_24640 [Pseudomonas sp. GD03842]|nr:hypothetical protein [Pseudomonas sp. GD03842]MDH0749517.1 hypothetical protein [Pseudomonas sp. GD03842]
MTKGFRGYKALKVQKVTLEQRVRLGKLAQRVIPALLAPNPK